MRHAKLIFILIICVGALCTPLLSSAQATSTPFPESAQVVVSGPVSALDTQVLTVAGVKFDVSGLALDPQIAVGTVVSIAGQVSPTSVVVAQTIIIINVSNPTATPVVATATATPNVTPTASSGPTPTTYPPVIVIVEGPIINLVNNIITVYNFNIEVEPQHPLLTIIDIGDVIHVEGAFATSGVIVANVVSNVNTTVVIDTGATVGLEGPVEAIDGNILIINGIPVQLAPNDPLLQTVQIGNFVNVQGNFENSGNTVVLVVINIIVINNVVINNNPTCWYHEGMGMGHWHCDGMGMGMGMGDKGMGMGMGDDGMGMGMGMGG